MQTFTYVFFGIVGLMIVGFIYVKVAAGQGGKKLVEKGMQKLQAGDFSTAYNCFAPALSQTLGTDDYRIAVQGLARAYKMSGASADVGELLQYGRDVQAMLKDPRIDKSKRNAALREIKERITRALKDLPQL